MILPVLSLRSTSILHQHTHNTPHHPHFQPKRTTRCHPNQIEDQITSVGYSINFSLSKYIHLLEMIEIKSRFVYSGDRRCGIFIIILVAAGCGRRWRPLSFSIPAPTTLERRRHKYVGRSDDGRHHEYYYQ